MKKYYNDKGEVAVLVSYGYGAGWSTWGSDPQMVFSPELVQAILDEKKPEELKALAKELFPNEYEGGAKDLEIEWLAPGTQFCIDEYDGAESLRLIEDLSITA